jgi:hypothetical protein
VLQRVSFLSDSFEYDPCDPDGYRSGVINVSERVQLELAA